MNWWMVAAALCLPWITGALWLRSLYPEPSPGRWPFVLGYGYLLGLVGLTLMIRLYALLGLPLSSPPIMAALVILALVAARRIYREIRPARTPDHPGPASFLRWQTVAIPVILFWLGLRFIGLALEVWWQPLFPWDAWTTWVLRARVWSELLELVPFVSPNEWLADPTGHAYTIEAWDYPSTVSLIATWPVLAFGSWNETLANLPWLGCALALGLGFYGQARGWGASPLTASVFLWLLMSLPLLETHVALAGYADLWLATALGFAFMSSLRWARDGDPRHGLLAVALLLACTLIKVEGLAWSILFAVAWLIATLSTKVRRIWVLGAVLLLAGLAAVLLMSGGIGFEIPWIGEVWLGPNRIELPHLGRFDLAPAEAWEPVSRHLFLYGSWHLFPYLLVVALVSGSVYAIRRPADFWFHAGLAWVWSSLLAFYILFFWTDASLWAIKATSTNRVFLHFTPAFMFWMMGLSMLLLSRAGGSQLASDGTHASQPWRSELQG